MARNARGAGGGTNRTKSTADNLCMECCRGKRAAGEAGLTLTRRGNSGAKGLAPVGTTGAEIARADAGDNSELGTYKAGGR
jgi:hypothetical protein